MVIMNILRMLVDLSFYAAFAGLIAAGQGGTGAMGGMLLQSLCFGLSALGGKKRVARLACLLPMALCWVIWRANPVDCILMAPAGAYVIWLVWRGEYALDQERQQRLFTLFWKLALAAILFGFFVGAGEDVTGVTVPYTVMMLVGSVFLMRSLRHEPEIYSGRNYQLVNGAAILAVAVVGYLMSARAVLNGVAAAVGLLYRNIVLPVVYLFLGLLLMVLKLVSGLFRNLELVPVGNEGNNGAGDIDISSLLAETGAPGTLAELVRKMLVVLLICAGALLLALFFRWLNGKTGTPRERIRERELRVNVAEQTPGKETRGSPAVRSIRAQYRKFLKLCVRQGMQLKPDTTSLDVNQFAQGLPGAAEASGEIRGIYLLARYGNKADRETVRKMKNLLDQTRKGSSQ